MPYSKNKQVDEKERAIVIGLFHSSRQRDSMEQSLAELSELAETAGAEVIEKIVQERAQPDPAFFVGKGKIEQIEKMVKALEADLLIFDDSLTPRQKANIEENTQCKTIDRTQLILDIFAQRANTKEGILQVELAQLIYTLPRLTGKGVELSRLGGGIGTRGPGETKLEVDRRVIKSRIQALKREMEKIKEQRSLQRRRRKEKSIPTVALVGYTNAGKSTLFNQLTNADALVSPQLFATLDPLMRRAKLPSGDEILVSDTVGFIRKLPHDLVAAFRATLEEVVEADLLLHVIDISEENHPERIAAVEAVLQELNVNSLPRINVFNKMDLLNLVNPETLNKRVKEIYGNGVLISAAKGLGLDRLRSEISTHLKDRSYQFVFRIPYSKANLISLIHEKGKVLKEKFTQNGIRIEAEIPKALVEQNPELTSASVRVDKKP